jgi:hypothetical protein
MNHSFLGVEAIPPLSPRAFVACSGITFYMPVVQALYSPKIHNLKHKNIILSNLKIFWNMVFITAECCNRFDE